MLLSKLFINVIINVLFISLFIGIFFFTYGAYIEKIVVNNQMKYLANNITDIIKLFGYDINNLIATQLNQLEPPDLAEEDHLANQSNKNTMKLAIIINIIFTILVITIVYFVYKNSNNQFSIIEIIIKNLILLVFIGCTEYIFLTYFGSKYISINPNAVKLSIIQNLKNIKNG